MPPPADEPPEDARLVETGSFRIDSAKAREKFGKFAFADPWEFTLAWARLLALSKPRQVRIWLDGDVSILDYDGDPLPQALSTEPFAGLETAGEDERARLFSLGYVSALGLSPVKIEVRSSQDAPRHQIRIEWPGRDAAQRHFALGPRLQEALRLLPADVEVDGVASRRMAELPGVERGFSAGLPLFIEETSAGEPGRILVYKGGVLAYRRDLQGFSGLSAHIEGESIPLDLTGCRAAVGPRLQELVDVAAASLMDRVNNKKLANEREIPRSGPKAISPLPTFAPTTGSPPRASFASRMTNWSALGLLAAAMACFVYSWTPERGQAVHIPHSRIIMRTDSASEPFREIPSCPVGTSPFRTDWPALGDQICRRFAPGIARPEASDHLPVYMRTSGPQGGLHPVSSCPTGFGHLLHVEGSAYTVVCTPPETSASRG